MIKLEIHPVFEKENPPQTGETLAEMEAMFLADGIREPIIYWPNEGHNWIVDGHTRYGIAIKHDIPFTVLRMDFFDEDDARRFIIRTQLNRRNLNEVQQSYARGKLARETASSTPGRKAEDETHGYVAETLGVSESTLRRDKKKAEALDTLAKPAREAILNRKVKANSKDIVDLCKLDAKKQAEVIDDVVSGKSESIKVRLMDELREEACPKGGDHEWTSDGEGARYCAKCLEPDKAGEWEQLAILHKEAKAQLDAIRRSLRDRADSYVGGYLRTQIQRLVSHLEDAAILVRMHEPVGEKDGQIITRIQREQAKR